MDKHDNKTVCFKECQHMATFTITDKHLTDKQKNIFSIKTNFIFGELRARQEERG